VEPGTSPSHIANPIAATAHRLTALVSTKISTERRAIRATDTPLLRSTQAPSAMPARPLTETTELTASSASDRRELRLRPMRPNTRSNRITYPAHEASSKATPSATHDRLASEIRSAAARSPGTASSIATTSAKNTARLITLLRSVRDCACTTRASVALAATTGRASSAIAVHPTALMNLFTVSHAETSFTRHASLTDAPFPKNIASLAWRMGSVGRRSWLS
jgi:hypothetical protein